MISIAHDDYRHSMAYSRLEYRRSWILRGNGWVQLRFVAVKALLQRIKSSFAVHSFISVMNVSRTPAHLPNAGNHAISFLLVFPTQVLPISTLFLLRPNAHLRNGHDNKNCRAPRSIDQEDCSPGHGFKHVVRACYPVKAQASWNTTLCTTWRAQRAENEMSVQVPELTYRVQS